MTVWTQVPDAIKSQYQNPPSMLLPAGVRQLELVCSGVPDHQPAKHLTTDAEQQEVSRGKATYFGGLFCVYSIDQLKSDRKGGDRKG